MTDETSGNLLARWRQGDQQAAQALFERYADRLMALARSRLSAKLTRRVDPEDVVQSVYRSFFADARAGRYDLQLGGDLWRLLLTITLFKLNDQVKRHTCAKRAVGEERVFGTEDSLAGICAHLESHEPSPLEAAALADEVAQIMGRLEALHRRILELRLQGHNIFEVAGLAGCGERTVRRVLQRVKQLLEQSHGAAANS